MCEPRPIPMGRKGERIDWDPFRERARECLGYVPLIGKPLKKYELARLGFVVAAEP